MGSFRKNNGICPEPEPDSGEWGIQIVETEFPMTKKTPRGAYLTWEDLGVSVSSSKSSVGKEEILTGVSGYAKPGEIVAIMGPSGCGKSTLLDSLAGRLSSNIRKSTGRVLINGRKQRLTHGTMAYMAQEQVLTWTLTVKETVYYSADLQLPKLMPKSEKRQRADTTIREMGLQDCMNTRIGGWGTKGLSGGQRRRLSICLELLTHPKILLLDEPTSGLDSAASYYVMKQIVKLTHEYQMTVVAAIHQPSSQVFGFFNNLCLLSSGKEIYFGPTFEANQFFAVNGFPCPDRQSPADHYLMTINTDFNEDTVGGNIPVEQVINKLAESYKSSHIYKNVRCEIATLCGAGGDVIERKGSLQTSFITQCLLLSKRSFINMYRDLGYYWLRLGIYIGLGLALGTLYYQIGHGFDSMNARISMIMFVAAFLTLLAIGGFPSFMEEMKVFQYERLNGHYGVGSYVISHAISSTPYLIVISLIPGAITYWLIGLQQDPSLFIYFVLVLFVSMLWVECLMMIVAAIVPNLLMGIISGAGIIGLMILGAGFFRLPNDLPDFFWRYPMYYISIHRYALQGLYKNEFQGLKFSEYAGGPATLDGEIVLVNAMHIEMGHSKWIDLGILFSMVVAYMIILLCSIKVIDRMRSINKAFRSCHTFRN